MNYESFRAAWNDALRDSRLQRIGMHASESLDLQDLDRTYKVYVEPLGGQDAPPFCVTATLSWTWDNLNTVRATMRDENVLSQMLGRDEAEDLITEPPGVHVDIHLLASAPYDKALPMPSQQAWARWIHETVERLDHIEPLLPNEILRENRTGTTEVLAWQDSPKVTAACDSSGELLLERVEISAGQLITLPRLPGGREDPDMPELQLTELFNRVRASLSAWMQAVDHLRPSS